MNVEIGTEAPIFLFWEYLFQIFGILSLQCMQSVPNDSFDWFFKIKYEFFTAKMYFNDATYKYKYPKIII
jgi:hypothetical protein